MKFFILLIISIGVLAKISLENIDTENGYTIINLEPVGIVNEYTNIIHMINITEIKDILNTLEANIESLNNTYIPKSVNFQIQSIRSEIQTISEHRPKRSLINVGGGVLKFIFGIMDSEDRSEIENQIRILTVNNHMA